MQKVLATGATGFIGIEVSRYLAEREMGPRLMVRCPVRGLMLRDLEAEIMQADIRNPDSLRRILIGIDSVVHLGARAAFEPYPQLYPSIVKGSINLMQAVIEAGVKNFVCGGSLLVYGDSATFIDQDTEHLFVTSATILYLYCQIKCQLPSFPFAVVVQITPESLPPFL